MKIILMRHGEPDIISRKKLKASELYQWIESYNSSGIKREYHPPKESIAAVFGCNIVVCSDLSRSIESARALGVKKINYIDSIFREAGLPYLEFSFPRLSPNTWIIIFRILWFLGFSHNTESLDSAKNRAADAAEKLKQFSQENESVLLIGHGITNRFIAERLLSAGWRGPLNPGKKYWEFGVYESRIRG